MRKYWATVRTSRAGIIKVYLMAENWYEANEMFKMLYGSDLASHASPC